MSKAIVVTQEGMVDFRRYPNSAIVEIAAKRAIRTTDPVIIVGRIRCLLLQLDGTALRDLLRDLRGAAFRCGVKDVVSLFGRN